MMKKPLKKLIALVIAIQMMMSTTAFAINKVYSIKSPYGIVADNADWSCKCHKTQGKFGIGKGLECVKGNAKQLPLSFVFYTNTIYWNQYSSTKQPSETGAIKYALDFLTGHAQKNEVVFSDVSLIQTENNYLIKGNYYDSHSSGYFAFYIRPEEDNQTYMMFIQIHDTKVDDSTQMIYFHKAIDLITPLVTEINLN